jgi:hypothetical protein
MIMTMERPIAPVAASAAAAPSLVTAARGQNPGSPNTRMSGLARAAKTPFEVELYSGTAHGFSQPKNKALRPKTGNFVILIPLLPFLRRELTCVINALAANSRRPVIGN